MLICLDPATPYAEELPKRADVTYFAMFAPAMNAHRITLEQMVILEPQENIAATIEQEDRWCRQSVAHVRTLIHD